MVINGYDILWVAVCTVHVRGVDANELAISSY